MKASFFVAVLLVLAVAAQSQTLYDCVSTNSQLSKFSSFWSQSAEVDFLKSASGTLMAFGNDASTGGTESFTPAQRLDNLKYLVAVPVTTVEELQKMASFKTKLDSVTSVSLGGEPQNMVINAINGQFFINNYAAYSSMINCGSSNIFVVSSYIYLPDTSEGVLRNNVDKYQVQTFLDTLKSTNMMSTANSVKTTLLAIPNSGMSSAGSLSASQISNHIIKQVIFSKSIPAEGLTVTAVSGNTIKFSKSGESIQVSIDGQSVNMDSMNFDMPSRNGVVHIVSGALTKNSAPSAASSFGLVTLLIAAVAARLAL